MRYYGFATRDYLISQQLDFYDDSTVLEIGVGTGSTAENIIGKVKEFYGVDISAKAIEQLSKLYANNKSVKFSTVDVCKDISLDRKFDIIFSADTLEHVERPEGFFNFISKHLSKEGIAFVTFPNESSKKHHGVTWFAEKQQLIDVIDASGLNIRNMFDVSKTGYHLFFEKLFWNFPRSILKSRHNELPQSFQDTQAFAINESGGIIKDIYALYARIVSTVTAFFPLYNLVESSEDITDRVILMKLSLNSNK